MFRLHDKVPEIYVQQSRDFQLLCRIYDAAFNGIKFDVDTIVDTLDAMTARDSILELFANKLGFFTDVEIDSQVLKYIVASFPYIIKYKGSPQGIDYAVNAILKAEAQANSDVLLPARIIIDNSDHSITIYTQQEVYNKIALSELLKYVVPCGYTFVNKAFQPVDKFKEDYFSQDTVTMSAGYESTISQVSNKNPYRDS